ncbi:MAG: RNA-binding S4 domain-containing protein [Neomegalonema sp.]|nr:RNA-binding S4 domain-containing protein [Neomegalonema sp.]
MSDAVEPRERLDKWLWRARFFKTRRFATDAVKSGKVRVNGVRTEKPGAGVKVGDVLTVARAGRVFVVRILDFGERRGPAAEAETLYEQIDA